MRAADEDQPLNEAKWLVFSAGGFATADEAHDYGERLRRAVRLAGISTIVGVDARTAGDDRTTSHLSPAGENWMRSLGLPRPEHRTASDVHGLSVRSDDDNLRDRLHRPPENESYSTGSLHAASSPRLNQPTSGPTSSTPSSYETLPQ